MPNLSNQRQNLSALVELVDIEIDSTNNFSFCNTAPSGQFTRFTHGSASEVPSGTRIYATLPFDFADQTETEAGPQPIVELKIGKLDGLFVNFLDQLKLDGKTVLGKKIILTLTRAQFIDNLVSGTTGRFIKQLIFTVDDFNTNDTKEITLKLKTPIDLALNLGQTILWEPNFTTAITTRPKTIFLRGISL